jgi:uncharacterized protein (TIGR02996 family)
LTCKIGAGIVLGMAKRSAAAIAKAMMGNAKSAASAAKTRPPKTESKPSAASGDHRAALTAAFGARDGGAALTAALAWWRETRAPALADLVDAISDRVSGSPATSEVEFTNLAMKKDAADLGRLLPALRELPVSFLPTASELLAAYADDPRIPSALVGWTTPPITTSTSKNAFWTKMFEIAKRTRDVRAIAGFKKRLAKKPEVSDWWERWYGAMRRVVAALEEVEPTPVKLGKLDPSKLQPVARGVTVRAVAPAPKLQGSLLGQALAHVNADRFDAAIEAMVARWREIRAPKLADLIDRATRLLPTYDLPLAPSDTLHAAWTTAFESDPERAMPQLLQNINVGDRKLCELRIAQLATLPDDPRVAWRLAELASSSVDPQRGSYWKPLFALLARIADPRTRALLREVFHEFTGTYYDHHRQAKRILSAFALSNDPAPELADPELGELEAALRRVPLPEWDLVDHVVEAWDDPGPRIVYADWLQERGNPRGELIVLETKSSRTPGEQRRLDELDAMPYLFGALEDIVDRREEGSRREHGLYRVIAVDFYASPSIWRRLAACPQVLALAKLTMRVLHAPTEADFDAFVGRARHLREIELDDENMELAVRGFTRKKNLLQRK